MNNPPITGINELDAYLYSLHLTIQDSNDTSSTLPPVDPTTGNPVVYPLQYISIKYADDNVGGGFSDVPTYKTYWGIHNSSSSVESINPSDYTWYPTTAGFGTLIFVYFLCIGARSIKFYVDTTPPSYKWVKEPGVSIDLDSLVPAETISFNELMDAAVTELKLADAAVTATKTNIAALNQATGGLNPLTVDAAQIMNNAVTELKILNGAITNDKIYANAVTADKIAANAIGANQIAANAVTAVKLEAGSVTADKITSGAVTSDKITANAVTSIKINAGAITSDKIAANSITAGLIAASNVITSSAQISDAIITNAKIANAAITSAKIGTAEVSTLSIAGNAVTVPAYSSLGSNFNGNCLYETTILSFSYSNGGYPITVIAGYDVLLGLGGSLLTVRVYVNGTLYRAIPISVTLDGFTRENVFGQTTIFVQSPPSTSFSIQITLGNSDTTNPLIAYAPSGSQPGFYAYVLGTKR